MPPIEPLAKWAKRKGLKLRDSKRVNLKRDGITIVVIKQ